MFINISINAISTNCYHFIKDELSNFNPLQKKVALIALAYFACAAVGYFVYHYFCFQAHHISRREGAEDKLSPIHSENPASDGELNQELSFKESIKVVQDPEQYETVKPKPETLQHLEQEHVEDKPQHLKQEHEKTLEKTDEVLQSADEALQAEKNEGEPEEISQQAEDQVEDILSKVDFAGESPDLVEDLDSSDLYGPEDFKLMGNVEHFLKDEIDRGVLPLDQHLKFRIERGIPTFINGSAPINPDHQVKPGSLDSHLIPLVYLCEYLSQQQRDQKSQDQKENNNIFDYNWIFSN